MKLQLLWPLFGAVACVPRYKPPTADQPHALVKLRRSYDTTTGTGLTETVDIDEHRALQQTTLVRTVQGARTDAILVHPVPSSFKVRGFFHHMETRLVHETYQVPHTVYRSESYDCSSGSGTNKFYRTCSRTVSQTEYETKYRDVWRQVQVTDAECDAGYRLAPHEGRVYLIQYTYHAQSVCSLSCFEQVPEEGGTFKNLPCPTAPPKTD